MTNEGTPDLSVVVISWKMRDLLEKMLESLILHTRTLELEIICVDNGSGDGTVEMIRERFPQIKLILNEVNRGVAPARNQGLRISRGRHIAILDADLELVEDALGPLVEFLDAHPEAGIVGSKLVFPDGTVQFNAKRFPSPFALFARRLSFLNLLDGGRRLSNHEMREWDRGDTREVDYLIGACQVFRRELLETVGLLDEAIFYGPEDVDFCLRTRRSGWQIWYLHRVRMIHHEQRVTKRNPLSRISRKHYLGLVYFFRKHGLSYVKSLARSER